MTPELNTQLSWTTGGCSYEIQCRDAADFLKSLPENIADIIFLDPPFNLGKHYEGAGPDNLSTSDYSSWLESIIDLSISRLADGGALYIYHLPRWAMFAGSILEPRLSFRHWIAISMKNNFARGKRLYPAHYALLYYTKGEPKSFYRPKLLPPSCRSCGVYLKDYGGYRKFIEDAGINLSDVWDDLSPVRHRNTKSRQANQLPIALTDRVVAISGFEKARLVDPFLGSGTSFISAQKHQMHAYGADISSASCALAANRLGINQE